MPQAVNLFTRKINMKGQEADGGYWEGKQRSLKVNEIQKEKQNINFHLRSAFALSFAFKYILFNVQNLVKFLTAFGFYFVRPTPLSCPTKSHTD